MILIIRVITILVISSAWLLPCFADTHTAASCSQEDISTKMAEAGVTDGDTVAFSGDCTWAGTLTISKHITLNGGGGTITHNNGGTALISLEPTDPDLDIRVTNINFENTDYLGTTDIKINAPTNKFRIDHCTVHLGKEAITMNGNRVNGVIDSNTFTDVDLAVRVMDDSTSSWDRAIAMGDSDNVFVENNTFTYTNRTGCNELNEAFYNQNAARSVLRYNTINNACTVTIDTHLDAHGNPGSDRGTVKTEIYNNQFTVNNLYTLGKIRGGTHLIYNNNVTTASGTTTIILRNEMAWEEFGGDTSWPSQEQVFNTFIWNNKYNGNDIGVNIAETDFIVEGRDYWLAPPSASGGKETFGGSAGYSNDYCIANNQVKLPAYSEASALACCTGTGTGMCDMSFSSTGANAYYPYSPYTCPHPLTGLSGSCDSTKYGTGGYNITANHTIGSGPQFSIGTGATVTIQ